MVSEKNYDIVVCGAGPAGIGAAASSGAEFLHGYPADGRIQLANFRWTIANIDRGKYDRKRPSDEEIIAMLIKARNDGVIQPPDKWFQHEGEIFLWNHARKKLAPGNWELKNVDPADPGSVSKALAECQAAALKVVRFLRDNMPGFENCEIGALPAVLGTRESRRILGKYVLTSNDVISGGKFDDGIAKAWFWIDLHDPPPGKTLPYSPEYINSTRPAENDWYEIPYRCLVPVKIENLLVAGRCISCDREALGSLRVMPTCFYTGEAAGTAAAMAVADGLAPHQLDGVRVRNELPGF